MSKTQIIAFTGDYSFLSNYYPADMTYNGAQYLNAEAAFQSAKCQNPIDRTAFYRAIPKVAKSMGRKVKMRGDWESVKVKVMEDVVHAKFASNPDLAQALINTGDAELIEGNTWSDNFWGVCSCNLCQSRGIKGENQLGKILMAEREMLKATHRQEVEEK